MLTLRKYLPHEGGSAFFREKRFQFFLSQINKLPRPLKILDIGGTQIFWEKMNFVNEPGISFTLANLYPQEAPGENFECIIADATDLPFDYQEFDIVFSNSVIEHLFTRENQVKMAREVSRVGKNYFIQTPNLYFPIEAHWLFPYWQFLPRTMRVLMTQHLDLGGYPKTKNRAAAIKRVEEVKLLSKKAMQRLFPDGDCYEEKFFSLTKSIVMYRFPEYSQVVRQREAIQNPSFA